MRTPVRTTRTRANAAARSDGGNAAMAQSAAAANAAACTCGRLRRLTRRVTQIYDQHLEPAGLTIAQFGILGQLMARGSISVGHLADVLVMDPTTLSRNLRPLVRDGRVQVARDPADRRRQMISLSGPGKSALRAAVPLWSKAQAQVASLVGDTDVVRLHQLIDSSLDRLGPT
jgi:DNA-binding MarR family transcriptional regulator